jgi:hypothetical protein
MKPRPGTPHKPKNRENCRKSAKKGRWGPKMGIFGLFLSVFRRGEPVFCPGKRRAPFSGFPGPAAFLLYKGP